MTLLFRYLEVKLLFFTISTKDRGQNIDLMTLSLNLKFSSVLY